MTEINHELSERQRKVVDKLNELGIPFQLIFHPPLPTIEDALAYWGKFEWTHCKNLFFRNHKGNRHYLVIFDCMQQLAIHEEEVLTVRPLELAPISQGILNGRQRRMKNQLKRNPQLIQLVNDFFLSFG